MFIRSTMEIPVTYRTNGYNIEIKPMAVTYVDDGIVSPQKLYECYDQRVDILTDEEAQAMFDAHAKAMAQLEEDKDSEANNNPEVANKPEVKDEVNKDSEANNNPEVKDPEDPSKELKSNTGDEEVDNFLNGETNIVPEGTTEITEEEANKLSEENKTDIVLEETKKPAEKKKATSKNKASKTNKGKKEDK